MSKHRLLKISTGKNPCANSQNNTITTHSQERRYKMDRADLILKYASRVYVAKLRLCHNFTPLSLAEFGVRMAVSTTRLKLKLTQSKEEYPKGGM